MNEFLSALAKALAPELAKHLRELPSDHVCQNGSQLGRAHCRIVRERIARGEPGAFIGPRRKHLLTREAYAEELAKRGARGPRKATESPMDGDDVETRIMRRIARRSAR